MELTEYKRKDGTVVKIGDLVRVTSTAETGFVVGFIERPENTLVYFDGNPMYLPLGQRRSDETEIHRSFHPVELSNLLVLENDVRAITGNVFKAPVSRHWGGMMANRLAFGFPYYPKVDAPELQDCPYCNEHTFDKVARDCWACGQK